MAFGTTPTSLISRLAWAIAAIGLAFSHQESASADDLVVNSTVSFSSLDGGPEDRDGVANGVLTVDSLMVSYGTIEIDVPVARFLATDGVTLLSHATIRPVGNQDAGPKIMIQAGRTISLGRGSAIIADGIVSGGSVRLCAGENIWLRSDSRVRADGGSIGGQGGEIELQAAGQVVLFRGRSIVHANGGDGGRVTLAACGPFDLAGGPALPEIENVPGDRITIKAGSIEAKGASGVGGSIELLSEGGGIMVSGSMTHLDATGTAAPGTVRLGSDFNIHIEPQNTSPAATIDVSSGIQLTCDDCMTLAFAPACTDDASCADGDPCTVDMCDAGECTNVERDCPSGQRCHGETGECACSDVCGDLDNDCDVDAADFSIFLGSFGRSQSDPAYVVCADRDSDGIVTFVDYQWWLVCYQQAQSPNFAPCDDANVCTTDACSAGACQHTDNTDPCDDGLFCTADDVCNGGVCVGSGNPCDGTACDEDRDACAGCSVDTDCDDGNPCTTDSCQAGACQNTNNTDPCDDGLFCTVDDACSDGQCVGTGDRCPGQICDDDNDACVDCLEDSACDDDNPCTDDACVAGICQFTNNTLPCDDHNACTTADTCDDGACTGGAPLNCDDLNPCTADSCDPVSGCQHSNVDGACNDDDLCNGSETCVNGQCTASEPLNCDDGNVCTDDACDPSIGCENTPNSDPCDDGSFCTASDLCTNSVCLGSGDACPSQLCDEDNDACVDCLDDSTCDDGNPCTDDACVAGACVNTNNTEPCNDGLFCTADDICTGGACVGSGDPCPDQTCDEASDACVGCIKNAECDDGNPCTDDACVAGACQNTNNTDPCDDGLFCTAVDVCTAGACVGSGDPCAGQACDEGTGTCGLSPPPPPIIDPHPASTSVPKIDITGTALFAVEVRSDSHGGSQIVPVSDDAFSTNIELHENAVNALYFTSIGPTGLTSAPATTFVTHDAQPPTLFIDFPEDGAEIHTPTTDVAGRVGDVLSGYMGLTVSVNGISAVVNVGIGANGTFFAQNVPLAPGGPTQIVATAADALGNTSQDDITVTRTEIPAGEPYLVLVSGSGQTGPMGGLLPDPIVVQLFKGDGQPFANKIATFHVARSNGRLTSDGIGIGQMAIQVRSDANGFAQAFWQLGYDAGHGNNRVVASSRDITGAVVFCASATAGPPKQINIGSGDNQRCEAGAPATQPLRAWVNDGCNGVPDVPVIFTVVHGSGSIDGQSSVTVNTGATGHAQVQFTLGDEPGTHRVQATFDGNTGPPAEFNLWGMERDPANTTSFHGIVLNNGGQPIGGAVCTLIVGDQDPQVTSTDQMGLFEFPDAGAAGLAELFVDGTVADTVGGNPIPPGSYPFLHFLPILVPNTENCIPMPILLPKLNPNNVVMFDNTCDVELTVEGIEGLKMIITRGSMKRADGTIPSPEDPATLSLNQVHFQDIPMPMPDGASPPFAWTLQPGGSFFDPPVRIVYPNMSGLPAGAIAYFLSFNHGTNRFEIIASGHVDDEGLLIESDPGVGIATAGWGGNCPPYNVTGDVMNMCGDIEINSLSPAGILPLGTDLTIQYTISMDSFDEVTLDIINNVGNTIVYSDSTLPTSVGTHTVTWPEGKWNQGSTAYANPLNGPYLIAVSGKKGLCFPTAVGSINTTFQFSINITDEPPSGVTVSRTAGLDDMLDALKVIVRKTPTEFEFTDGQIQTADIPDGQRITIADPLLDALFDGVYEIVLKDLRDAIGNFSDEDSDLSNGAEYIAATVELK